MNTMSEIMQKRIEQHVTERIPLTFAYQDNIIIAGLSDKHHDETVDYVLETKSNNIFIQSARTSFYGLRLIKVEGPKIWNALPKTIRNNNLINIFCKMS